MEVEGKEKADELVRAKVGGQAVTVSYLRPFCALKCFFKN